MPCVQRAQQLRSRLSEWRAAGERIALVPTMGNLHEGHLTLVRRALQETGRTIVTLFVNPLQFGAGEDFEEYPRTPERDLQALKDLGVDLTFMPEAKELLSGDPKRHTRVTVPDLDDVLCGGFRPGHFTGVATIITKLFNLVQPDLAVFGEKDYQQLLVIRRLTADLGFDVDIVAVPTVREPDGLAMSSRNRYLDKEERTHAARFPQVLHELAGRIRAGERDYARLEREAIWELAEAGFVTEYVSVRDALTLAAPGAERQIVLGAVRLGRTRLIDNVPVNSDPTHPRD